LSTFVDVGESGHTNLESAAGIETGQPPRALTVFSREMDTLFALPKHPNVVGIVGVTVDPHSGFPAGVVSEMLDFDLHTVLETFNLRLSIDEIVSVSLDILRAVSFLHGQGAGQAPILHRGITARNILFQGGRCKLGDLLPSALRPLRKRRHRGGGDAQAAPDAEAQETETDILTRTFRGPEVERNGTYTRASDMFSVGMILLRMCGHGYTHHHHGPVADAAGKGGTAADASNRKDAAADVAAQLAEKAQKSQTLDHNVSNRLAYACRMCPQLGQILRSLVNPDPARRMGAAGVLRALEAVRDTLAREAEAGSIAAPNPLLRSAGVIASRWFQKRISEMQHEVGQSIKSGESAQVLTLKKRLEAAEERAGLEAQKRDEAELALVDRETAARESEARAEECQRLTDAAEACALTQQRASEDLQRTMEGKKEELLVGQKGAAKLEKEIRRLQTLLEIAEDDARRYQLEKDDANGRTVAAEARRDEALQEAADTSERFEVLQDEKNVANDHWEQAMRRWEIEKGLRRHAELRLSDFLKRLGGKQYMEMLHVDQVHSEGESTFMEREALAAFELTDTNILELKQQHRQMEVLRKMGRGMTEKDIGLLKESLSEARDPEVALGGHRRVELAEKLLEKLEMLDMYRDSVEKKKREVMYLRTLSRGQSVNSTEAGLGSPKSAGLDGNSSLFRCMCVCQMPALSSSIASPS
jgi:serine/threonine protein kinase